MTFELASYAMVDTVEIKFPAGFVYKFDLVLYDDKVRGLSVMTITVRTVFLASLQCPTSIIMLLLVFLGLWKTPGVGRARVPLGGSTCEPRFSTAFHLQLLNISWNCLAKKISTCALVIFVKLERHDVLIVNT